MHPISWLCLSFCILFQCNELTYAEEDAAVHLSMRGIVKTQKVAGDIHHHLVLNESEYGEYLGLRPVEKTRPERNGLCEKRVSDNKWACFPDFVYIGTSKSGTTSMAAHLAHHPMVQNILSKKETERRKSKEGHYWEVENTGRKTTAANLTAMNNLNLWVNYTKREILELQEGFDDITNRPVLIEYSPNYFVLDHVPEILKAEFKYKIKFIVSLRDPITRAISSWKFKANEGLKLAAERKKRKESVWPDDPFNITMKLGMEQAHCISKCYERTKDMKKCSITTCRAINDRRGDGRNGRYSYYAHVVKSLYAYQFLMWFSYFPKSDFFIFTIEQYRKNPVGVTEALLNFMGLPLYDPSGKLGFKDKKTLIDILSVIMNETPVAIELEKQISRGDLADLREFFSKEDKMLKEVLGWRSGYYT